VVLLDGVPLGPLPPLAGGAQLRRLSQLSASELSSLHLAESGSPAAPGDGAAFIASLNGALASDALLLSLPPGCALSSPVHVIHFSSGGEGEGEGACAAFPRLLVSLAAGASAEVVEEFAHGAERSRTLAVFCCVLGESASLRHARLALSPPAAGCLLLSSRVRQAKSSEYRLTEALLAAPLSRSELLVEQLGPATVTELSQASLSPGATQAEQRSRVALSHPDGIVRQLHKVILASSASRSAFDGGVAVGKAAQRTDAGQLSRSLLLARGARAHVRPSLQIVADDVRCTHGCTVAELSEEELFYFAARGVGRAAARQALVFSFVAEVTERLGQPELRGRARAAVSGALEGVLVENA